MSKIMTNKELKRLYNRKDKLYYEHTKAKSFFKKKGRRGLRKFLKQRNLTMEVK